MINIIGKWLFFDALSILRFSTWIFYLVFGLHLQTDLKPAFFLLLLQVIWSLLYFSDRYFVHISWTKKMKAGFPFVGWCMTNIVFNQHTQIRKIERGMTDQPFWQWLGWPSSYTYVLRTVRPILPSFSISLQSVSYTHLTLPTILLV